MPANTELKICTTSKRKGEEIGKRYALRAEPQDDKALRPYFSRGY